MVFKHFSQVCRVSLKSVGYTIGLLSCALSISCTRTVNQTAHITLSLPQEKVGGQSVGRGASSTMALAHVIINVTGPGISSPAFLAWDWNNGKNVNPVTFSLTVPGGSGRLVQVLAVYSNGIDSFYYGDVTSDINADTVLPVTIAPLGNAAVGEGSVAGRYLTATGTGPTGNLRIMYTPTGKPAMLIGTDSIVGGFFGSFALSGIGFNYLLDDGTDIFAGPLDLATYAPAGAQVSFYLPQMYSQHGSGSTPSYQLKMTSSALFGYFGPGAATNTALKICYPSANGSLNGAYSDAGITPITYKPSGTAGNAHVLSAGSRAMSSAILDSQGLCTDTITGDLIYTNYLAVDAKQIANQDQSLAFRGPYQSIMQTGSNWRNAFNVVYSVDGITPSFTYLPGVVTSGTSRTAAGFVQGVDGTDIFYRAISSTYTNSRDFEGQNGNADCSTLGSLSTPFVFAQSVVVPNTPTLITVSSADVATMTGGGTLQAIACPYELLASGKVYLPASVEAEAGGSMSGPGGPAQANAFLLSDTLGQAITSGAPTFELTGACIPLVIAGANGATPASLGMVNPANITVTPTAFGGSVTYYGGDPSCVTPSLPSPFVSGGTNAFLIFVKGTLGVHASGSLVIADTADGLTPLTANIQFHDPAATPAYLMSLGVPSVINQYGCYPLHITELVDGSSIGLPMLVGPNPSATSASVTYAAAAGVVYYTDPACMTVASASPYVNLYGAQLYSGGNGSSPLYFSYTGAPIASTNISLASSVTPYASFSNSNILTVNPANAPTRINVGVNNLVTQNLCTAINIQLQDSSGNPVPAPTASVNATLTLAAGSVGQFFLSPSCSAGGATSANVNIGTGQTFATAYYLSSTFGNASMTAAVSSPFVYSTSPTITVAPPPPTVAFFALQADSAAGGLSSAPQTFTSGTNGVIPSTAPNIMINSTATVTVYAANYTGAAYNIATGFNGAGYSVTISGTGVNGTSVTIPFNFVNGAFTFSINTAASPGMSIAVNLTSPANTPYLSGYASYTTFGPTAPTLNMVSPVITTAGAPAHFIANLSAPAAGPVSFFYTTTDGTAASPSSYTARSGTMTIMAGATSVTLPPVTTLANGLGWNFTMNISAISGATPGVVSALTTLGKPTVMVSSPSTTAGGTLFFVVSLIAPENANMLVTPLSMVLFNYATASGAATTVGTDYTAASGSVTINAGSSTSTIMVNTASPAGTGKTVQLNVTGIVNAAPAGGTVTGIGSF